MEDKIRAPFKIINQSGIKVHYWISDDVVHSLDDQQSAPITLSPGSGSSLASRSSERSKEIDLSISLEGGPYVKPISLEVGTHTNRIADQTLVYEVLHFNSRTALSLFYSRIAYPSYLGPKREGYQRNICDVPLDP